MKTTVSRLKIFMSAESPGIVSHAGVLLLPETCCRRHWRATGLRQYLSQRMQRWRPARAIHDPGKIIADLALTLALGGDCLADIALVRSQPEVFGPVASDPTNRMRQPTT